MQTKAGVHPIADLNMQLGFYGKIAGLPAVMDALKKAGSVRAASDVRSLTGYEKPATQSETVKKQACRVRRRVIINKYAGGKTVQSITECEELDGRSKPAGGVYVAWKMQKRLQGGFMTVYEDDNGQAGKYRRGQLSKQQAFRLGVQGGIFLDLNIRTGSRARINATTGETT